MVSKLYKLKQFRVLIGTRIQIQDLDPGPGKPLKKKFKTFKKPYFFIYLFLIL